MALLSISAPITADANLGDYFFLYNVCLVDASLAPVTLTLPELTSAGSALVLIRIDASQNAVTLAASSIDNQPVNNASSLDMPPGYSASLVATSEGWWTY